MVETRVRNKIRREAFEALEHLREANRLQRVQRVSWQFIDWVLHKETSGWSINMLALFLGPLTDDTDPLLLYTLPKHVSLVLPHTCRKLQKPTAAPLSESKSWPDQSPVMPWGPECGTEGPLLSLGWDNEYLQRLKQPLLSSSIPARAPLIHPPKDSNGDTDMDWDEEQEANYLDELTQGWDIDDDYDYYEDIKCPDYRFVCQIHELLLEFATEISERALEAADEEAYYGQLGHRTETLFQVLRARAFHLCETPSNLFGRKGVAVKKITSSSKDLDRTKGQEKATTCGICLEQPDPNRTVPLIDCGHHFCGSCLMRWALRAATCPSCRKPIRAQTLLPHVQGPEIDECLVDAVPREVLMWAFGKLLN